MWDDGAKLISRPVSSFPLPERSCEFLTNEVEVKIKTTTEKKQTNFNQPSQPQ